MTTGRAHRRLERPREQVLASALEMVAEQGLAGMTMAALGARIGTSGGHLLYYFGSKDQLLLETLRWSETTYGDRRADIAETQAPTVDTLVEFADLYLPVDRADPRWLLWVELWARAPYDEQLVAGQRELDAHWRAALTRVVTAGVAARTFACDDIEGWCDRVLALLDGFAIAVVTGATADRGAVLDHCRAVAQQLRS